MSGSKVKIKLKRMADELSSEELYATAMRHHQAGDIERAKKLYDQLIARDSAHADALHLAGVASCQMGNASEGVRLIARSLTIDDSRAQVYDNLGVALKQAGDTSAAIDAHRRAIDKDKNYGMAHYNIGVAYQEQGAVDLAAVEYEAAIRLIPTHPEAHTNLGECYDKMGDSQRALVLHRRAAELAPKSLAAQRNLGLAHYGLREYEAAQRAFLKALKLAPRQSAILADVARCAANLADWETVEMLMAPLEEALRADIRSGREPGLPPFDGLYLPLPDGLQLSLARAWAAHYADGVVRVTRIADAIGGPLKVGFLSPDFSRHAVGFLLGRLFSHRDSERIQVFAYALGGPDDAYRQFIAADVDAFVDLSGQSDAGAAQCIADDGIQVLVDLVAYTTHARPGILARRPAPVQCHWLGYTSTMGATWVDYYITSQAAVPVELEPQFAEALIRLPETLIGAGPFSAPATGPQRSDYGLPDDGVVFAYFGRVHRIDRMTFESWMRVLSATEGSVLWLKDPGGETAARLAAAAEAAGVDPKRLVYSPGEAMSERWHHRLADIWLDAFALTSGTAGVLAAWAGLPMVTLAGDRPQERTGASMVTAAGVPELAVESPEAFEALAIELAKDAERRADIRERLIAGRKNAPLFDPARFMRHLEAGLREAWRRRSAGDPPDHINVEAIDD